MSDRRTDGSDPVTWSPGDYGYFAGFPFAKLPNGLLAALKGHHITERGDGTWTVTPSIRTNGVTPDGQPVEWHGYLIAGEWREV